MSDVPKNFILTCPKCRYKEMSTGMAEDLKHLHEIANSCSNCGKPRSFFCPRCKSHAKLLRVKVRVG